MLISNPFKKMYDKSYQQKVMEKQIFLHHCHVDMFPSYNFLGELFAMLLSDSKSASNTSFIYHIERLRKKCFAHISTFCKLLCQTCTERLKKEKYLSKCVLEFTLGICFRSGSLRFVKKMSKSLYPRVFPPLQLLSAIMVHTRSQILIIWFSFTYN